MCVVGQFSSVILSANGRSSNGHCVCAGIGKAAVGSIRATTLPAGITGVLGHARACGAEQGRLLKAAGVA